MLAASKRKAITFIGVGVGAVVGGWLGLEGPSVLHELIQVAVITQSLDRVRLYSTRGPIVPTGACSA